VAAEGAPKIGGRAGLDQVVLLQQATRSSLTAASAVVGEASSLKMRGKLTSLPSSC